MSDENKQDASEPTPASAGSVRKASGRICTVPYEDPLGPFLFGLMLALIVGGVLLALLVAFCNLMEYGQIAAPESVSSTEGAGR